MTLQHAVHGSQVQGGLRMSSHSPLRGAARSSKPEPAALRHMRQFRVSRRGLPQRRPSQPFASLSTLVDEVRDVKHIHMVAQPANPRRSSLAGGNLKIPTMTTTMATFTRRVSRDNPPVATDPAPSPRIAAGSGVRQGSLVASLRAPTQVTDSRTSSTRKSSGADQRRLGGAAEGRSSTTSFQIQRMQNRRYGWQQSLRLTLPTVWRPSKAARQLGKEQSPEGDDDDVSDLNVTQSADTNEDSQTNGWAISCGDSLIGKGRLSESVVLNASYTLGSSVNFLGVSASCELTADPYLHASRRHGLTHRRLWAISVLTENFLPIWRLYRARRRARAAQVLCYHIHKFALRRREEAKLRAVHCIAGILKMCQNSPMAIRSKLRVVVLCIQRAFREHKRSMDARVELNYRKIRELERSKYWLVVAAVRGHADDTLGECVKRRVRSTADEEPRVFDESLDAAKRHLQGAVGQQVGAARRTVDCWGEASDSPPLVKVLTYDTVGRLPERFVRRELRHALFRRLCESVRLVRSNWCMRTSGAVGRSTATCSRFLSETELFDVLDNVCVVAGVLQGNPEIAAHLSNGRRTSQTAQLDGQPPRGCETPVSDESQIYVPREMEESDSVSVMRYSAPPAGWVHDESLPHGEASLAAAPSQTHVAQHRVNVSSLETAVAKWREEALAAGSARSASKSPRPSSFVGRHSSRAGTPIAPAEPTAAGLWWQTSNYHDRLANIALSANLPRLHTDVPMAKHPQPAIPSAPKRESSARLAIDRTRHFSTLRMHASQPSARRWTTPTASTKWNPSVPNGDWLRPAPE